MSPEERTYLVHVITTVRFTPVRLREGYEMGEVDALLDQLAASVAADQPIDDLVRAARPARVRLREAYKIAEVEALLEQLAPGSRPAPATSSQESVIQERRGLLSRVFGR